MPQPLDPAPRFDKVFRQGTARMDTAEKRTKFRLPKVLARRGGKVGRPPKNIRPNFTPEQIETALQVVMYSKVVYNWVVSEAKFLGVDLNTPKGHEFFKKNAREAALRLIG